MPKNLSRFLLAALLTAGALAGPAEAKIPQFSHVVVIIQENRTPDNLFHGLDQLVPGVDIASVGLNSKGESIPLAPSFLANGYDLDHSHTAFLQTYDGGRLDGADKVKCYPTPGNKCPAHPQFQYVYLVDDYPYWQMAEEYGFANRMFQTNQGPSFPAHQFLIAGTSAPTATSGAFAAENTVPWGVFGSSLPSGCVSPPTVTVRVVAANGLENTSMYPCFEHQTLMDLLDHPPAHPAQPISWHYYTLNTGGIWTAPNAISHLCVARGAPLTCTGAAWKNGSVVIGSKRILSDIKAKELPAVSWVIPPTGLSSDHAGGNDGTGPSWVAAVVNAVGQSDYWKDTAILVTWDDWGGWYDHVVPPINPNHPYYEYGFRVPLLVISPYTPKAYVSNVTHDFGSILNFIEKVWDLGSIPPGTFVDATSTDGLSDFFDFQMAPRAFTPISAPYDPDHFLNDTRPPTPPDNDDDED